MIPYQGSKRKIAKELLMAIPPAEHFYDLFGGGGAVTEVACAMSGVDMFGEYARWKHVHYNEIKTGVCELNRQVWSGTFDFEKARKTWISRERFRREKNEPTAWGAFVACCWSFGNGGEDYMYSQELELYKWLLHGLVTCENPFMRGTPKEKRLQLRTLIPAMVRESGIENVRDEDVMVSLTKIDTNPQRLQSLESLQSLQSLQRLQITNLDYRDVDILPDSVVYCDIPYQGAGAAEAYGGGFDHADFWDWAASREFPVYFSEYDCADPRFTVVWQKEVHSRMGKCLGVGGGVFRTEKLYWNGKGEK